MLSTTTTLLCAVLWPLAVVANDITYIATQSFLRDLPVRGHKSFASELEKSLLTLDIVPYLDYNDVKNPEGKDCGTYYSFFNFALYMTTAGNSPAIKAHRIVQILNQSIDIGGPSATSGSVGSFKISASLGFAMDASIDITCEWHWWVFHKTEHPCSSATGRSAFGTNMHIYGLITVDVLVRLRYCLRCAPHTSLSLTLARSLLTFFLLSLSLSLSLSSHTILQVDVQKDASGIFDFVVCPTCVTVVTDTVDGVEAFDITGGCSAASLESNWGVDIKSKLLDAISTSATSWITKEAASFKTTQPLALTTAGDVVLEYTITAMEFIEKTSVILSMDTTVVATTPSGAKRSFNRSDPAVLPSTWSFFDAPRVAPSPIALPTPAPTLAPGTKTQGQCDAIFNGLGSVPQSGGAACTYALLAYACPTATCGASSWSESGCTESNAEIFCKPKGAATRTVPIAPGTRSAPIGTNGRLALLAGLRTSPQFLEQIFGALAIAGYLDPQDSEEMYKAHLFTNVTMAAPDVVLRTGDDPSAQSTAACPTNASCAAGARLYEAETYFSLTCSEPDAAGPELRSSSRSRPRLSSAGQRLAKLPRYTLIDAEFVNVSERLTLDVVSNAIANGSSQPRFGIVMQVCVCVCVRERERDVTSDARSSLICSSFAFSRPLLPTSSFQPLSPITLAAPQRIDGSGLHQFLSQRQLCRPCISAQISRRLFRERVAHNLERAAFELSDRFSWMARSICSSSDGFNKDAGSFHHVFPRSKVAVRVQTTGGVASGER